jgi:hypothetical protein
MLKNNGCIVRPTDVVKLARDIHTPFEAQAAERKQRIMTEYFDKIVTGKDWHEIVARRLLLHAQRTGGEPFPLTNQGVLGEVKILGGVATDAFRGYLEPSDEHEYWRELLTHGFIPGPVYRGLEFQSNSYDVSPEKLGATLDDGRRFWGNILAAS